VKTIVVSQREVPALLPMGACVDLMAETLRTTSRGDAVLPLREMVWLPDRSGLLGLMPGYLGSPRALGLKVVSVMPGNHGTEYDSHQGVVLLFEVTNGSLLAVVDASGRSLQSVWFRFTNYNSIRLCMSYDGYQGIGLDDDKNCPWCRCKFTD